MPPIVTINVSQTKAPAPITLQETGAILSVGGTTLAQSSSQLITQVGDVLSILQPPINLANLTWSNGTAVATLTSPLPGGVTSGTFIVTIANALPGGFNGTFKATIGSGSSFSYSVTNPGSSNTSTPGTFTVPGTAELLADVTQFFAQGTTSSVYVLELGPSTPSVAIANLNTWIQNNPGVYYSYLVPENWDAQPTFITLLSQYTNLTSMTYFFVTTTTQNYTLYKGLKDVVWLIESPNAPVSEVSVANDFQHQLNYNPSAANRMTQNCFAFLFGVTPWPVAGNGAILAAIKAAWGNYVGTGAEGGLTNTILFWGTTGDGEDLTYWYSVDWIQLNADRNVANAVINGSNNPVNPLYYNQFGIDQLQDVLVTTVAQAVAFGLANGGVTRTSLDAVTFQQNLDNGLYAGNNVVNAVPFLTYTAQNPADYANGKYAGYSIAYIPQRGFKQVVINIDVTDLISQ